MSEVFALALNALRFLLYAVKFNVLIEIESLAASLFRGRVRNGSFWVSNSFSPFLTIGIAFVSDSI